MKIIISSELTDEQALILAEEKWYQKELVSVEDITVFDSPRIIIPNPTSPAEFIKNVYQNMIIEDSTKEFMKYKERTYLEEQRRQMEIDTRNEVISWISSNVE